MDRRKLAAVAVGLVLVATTAVLLRNEAGPDSFEKFVDPSIELVAAQPPQAPTNAQVTALDPDTLQIGWAGSAEGYDVRWNGRTVLVTSAEAELTGLTPDEEVAVEIRGVNSIGQRSAPLTVKAVPRKLHDDRWDDRLQQPIDRFDGPESLAPRQWRILGDTGCLGLRPFGTGKRLDVGCERIELQSNRPLRFGVPAPDGAIGRAVITVAGGQTGRVTLALLPEPLQDIPALGEAPSVRLDLTTQGTRLEVDPRLPKTAKEIPLGDAATTGLVPDVRHRWEVRVLPDAIVALRDGVVVAAEPVALPWPVARPRISFEGNAMLDSFGIGGVPEREIPELLFPIGASGEIPGAALDQALSARLIMVPRDDNKVTVDFGGQQIATRVISPRVIAADIPVRDAVVRTSGNVDARYLVVLRNPAAGPGVLPRLVEQDPANRALPVLRTMQEQGRVLVIAEIGRSHRGIELELDGKRVLVLPTDTEGPSPCARHEVWLSGVGAGSHGVKLRLRPDQGEPVITEAVFDVRETP